MDDHAVIDAEPEETAPDAAPGTAVVKRATAPVAKPPVPVGALIPTLDEAWRMAQALALAEVVPKALRGKPSDTLAIILTGAELGLSPMKSIRGVHAINGATRISGPLYGALLRQYGHRWRVVERVPSVSCTIEITRGDTGEKHVESYTIEQAIAARLVKRVEDGTLVCRSKNNEPLPWELHTDRMLLWRSVWNGASIVAPEVAFGIGLAEDLQVDDHGVVVEQQESERVDRPTHAPPSIIDVESEPDPDMDEIAREVAAAEAEFLEVSPPSEPPAEAAPAEEPSGDDALFDDGSGKRRRRKP